MPSNIETAFKELLNCLQALKMYGREHPRFAKSLDSAYLNLQDVLAVRQEMVFGIVGEELAFEKEILFELGKFMRPSILYLKERNIERIAFFPGLSKEELGIFVNTMARPKEDFKGDLQEMLILAGVEHIQIGKLRVDAKSEQDASGRVQLSLYDSSIDQVSQALSGVLNSEKIDHLALKFSLNNIMENLSAQRNELLKLATLKRYDVETYTHMLNVSILAMYFTSRLGLDKTDVQNIGIAAIFHDIGKLSISRKVLHKPGALTDLEFGRIKSHTVLGAQIMLNYVATLGILPVVVSFEHHLKYDSSGYPRLPRLRKQHMASAIVSVCDVYDALSQKRSYKQDYSPDLVYNIMNRDEGGAFDPQLLKEFFKFIGIWPVGSVVALNDGSIAWVKDVNESDIRRPKIEIISPVEKRRSVDLAQDNSLNIERFLNPWNEGKEFLHLI